MRLLATTYNNHAARSGRVILIRISRFGVVSMGSENPQQAQHFYHISTTELPEHQETPGNKKDLKH